MHEFLSYSSKKAEVYGGKIQFLETEKKKL